jgi:16S rRNA processing protein RimM
LLVVKFRGVDDRNAAEALNGTELFVDRTALPPPASDEYYHADLIGLNAVTDTGAPLGVITAIHNFGAGDILEIAPASGPSLLVPFTDANVPAIDIDAGRAMVIPPPEAKAEPGEESA